MQTKNYHQYITFIYISEKNLQLNHYKSSFIIFIDKMIRPCIKIIKQIIYLLSISKLYNILI
jgi:hypothetical protein